MKWTKEIGDTIVDFDSNGMLYTDFIITARELRNGRQYYKYKCNICGWDNGWKPSTSLHSRCLCCVGKAAIPGINTLGDVRPDLVMYFKNRADAFACTPKSDKKFTMKCPQCGHEHTMVAKNLYRRHYSCPRCGDGYSYPEKFVTSFFDQLKIQHVYHYGKAQADWCDSYVYDF